MHCNYCEREMLFSDSIFDTRLKGRICKDCAQELYEDENKFNSV